MKIKLDENLPFGLVSSLAALGHDVHTPQQEGLSGAMDSQLGEGAQRDERFLITQDMDFSDARRFIPGTHHGLLIVRLHDPNRRALLNRVEWLFRNEDVATWKHCFVVATEHKVRIRRAST